MLSLSTPRHTVNLLALFLLSLAPSVAHAQYGGAVKLANLADTRVVESSGVCASRLYPDPVTGVLWTHNDSGFPYLYATNRKGQALACFRVGSATIVDWEDIAGGPGVYGAPALYIADIGDNNRVRTNLAIYRVPEPDIIHALAYPGVAQSEAADRIPFAYPGGNKYDAETLLVHPLTGEGFIVTKDSGGTSKVFLFNKPLPQYLPGETATLTQVATVKFSSWLSYGRTATGGDISLDGRKLVIRTYTQAHEWPINTGQTVGQALTANARKSFSLPFAQGEGITYRTDGRALLFTHEASPCPLYELPPR